VIVVEPLITRRGHGVSLDSLDAGAGVAWVIGVVLGGLEGAEGLDAEFA